MENILLIIHLLIALALVGVVLMQRSEGGALGIGGAGGGGGGGMGGMFSARGAANALTRATAILAICFMFTSLMLAILSGNKSGGSSILDQGIQPLPAQTEVLPEAGAATENEAGEPLVPLSQ